MGATNTTANYNLSQFIGTDKPAWLQDYNGDMLKIDTGINAAKVAADGAQNAASAAQNDATTANNAITNTINPAISSLNTTVGNQGGAINTINSLIGNGTPTTTDQTIIGAINELLGDITWKNGGSATGTNYVTFDPGDWRDIFIKVVDPTGGTNRTFCIPIARGPWSYDTYDIRTGYYLDNSNNMYCSVGFTYSATGVNIHVAQLNLGSNDRTSVAELQVYYR